MVQIELNRVDEGISFESTDVDGHSIKMDGSVENGGNNAGVRPMQALLMALGACSGIDVVTILKKQRQEVTNFKMSIEGERETGKEPALWKYVHITFKLNGNIDVEKANKACALSMNKYCSVAATLRAAGCVIEWETVVNIEI
jgi:putative redox protein